MEAAVLASTFRWQVAPRELLPAGVGWHCQHLGKVGHCWLPTAFLAQPWQSSCLSVSFQALAWIGGSFCFCRQVNMTYVQYHLVLLTLL